MKDYLNEQRRLEARKYLLEGMFHKASVIYENLGMEKEHRLASLLEARKCSSAGDHLNSAAIYRRLEMDYHSDRERGKHKRRYELHTSPLTEDEIQGSF